MTTEARKAYLKEWRRTHPIKYTEERKAYISNWCKNNRDKKNACGKRTRTRHKKKINAKARQDRKIRRDFIHQRDKACRVISIENFLSWKWSQTRAKRHARPITKNIDAQYLIDLWVKQDGKCAITKKKMVHRSACMNSVSIDRIDSSIGYEPGNIQLVCQVINLAKSTFSNDEMKAFWKETSQDSSEIASTVALEGSLPTCSVV